MAAFASTAPPTCWRDDYFSWGRTRVARHLVGRPAAAADVGALLDGSRGRPFLAYGCGRSYGDVALNPEGMLVDCRGLDRFIRFDRSTGFLDCEAGVQLTDILVACSLPEADGSGWLLPVTPGTRFVTVGGAIANDVHGKNHHRFGCFGRHVLSFDLRRGDGQEISCSRSENADLFAATIGGLGLTGLIIRARLQLRRVPGLAVEAEDIRFGSLGEFFALVAASDAEWEYTAAWIDCLATGASRGRGILSRARHIAGRGCAPPRTQPYLTLPVTPPVSLARPSTVSLFNALYWRRLGPGNRRLSKQSYEKTFYPLDAVGGWNKLYGPRGFFQFQCALPIANSCEAVGLMLKVIAAAKQGSILSVLKVFGDLPSPGLISFPMLGATLALDFPNRGQETITLIALLERIAIENGGRIYPAKDSLMSANAFRIGFPQWEAFTRLIDPAFSSSFADRIGLCAEAVE